MSRRRALQALKGAHGEVGRGVTWVKPSLARQVLGADEFLGDADALSALAVWLGADLAFVDSRAPWAADLIERLHASDVMAVWSVPGPLGGVAERFGWPEMMRLSARAPGDLAAPLAEELRTTLDDVRRGASLGAQCVVVADDVASGAGWLVAPDFAFSVLVPCYVRVALECRALGLLALLHSDGDTRALFGVLATAGYSAVHAGTLHPGAFSAFAEAAWGHGLCFMGGVRTSCEVGDAATHVVALCRRPRQGALIVCDDGGMTTPEDVHALRTGLREARKDTEA